MECGKQEQKDIESYHSTKIDSKAVLKTKIVKQLHTHIDPPPLLVPNGLQVNSTLYVPKALHCCLYTSSSTNDNYVAHFGAGPENGVYTWTKEINESKVRKHKKRLNCRITNFVYVSSNYIVFASCDDLTIRTYGNQFREHSRLQLQHSILSMLYDEDLKRIVTGCVGLVQQWELNYSLHKPPILVNEVHLEDHISGVTPWISFLYNDKECRRIIALTGTAIFFLDSSSLQQIAFLENRHQFPLTVCLTYSPRQYLITGMINYSIWTHYFVSINFRIKSAIYI